MITFLERHAGITDVQYFERPPCATRDIENWERAHYPCVLPEDFKSFLRLSDGLLLKWAIKQGDLTQPLGCMQVNDVANLSPCPRGTFAPGEGVFDTGETPPECVAAFELDSNALDGRLALLYRAGALTKPQIWFQDLSATWFFIAHTFTDYFRLMMMHLGNQTQNFAAWACTFIASIFLWRAAHVDLVGPAISTKLSQHEWLRALQACRAGSTPLREWASTHPPNSGSGSSALSASPSTSRTTGAPRGDLLAAGLFQRAELGPMIATGAAHSLSDAAAGVEGEPPLTPVRRGTHAQEPRGEIPPTQLEEPGKAEEAPSKHEDARPPRKHRRGSRWKKLNARPRSGKRPSRRPQARTGSERAQNN